MYLSDLAFDNFSPSLSLANPDLTLVCELARAYDIRVKAMSADVSTLYFTLPAHDCEREPCETPHYTDVLGKRYVRMEKLGWFRLEDPVTESDGTREVKKCTAYSAEITFADRYIGGLDGVYGLNEILTEALARCPGWTLGDVDVSLLTKHRMFSVKSKNMLSFLRGDVQNAFQCIFFFDNDTFKLHVRASGKIFSTSHLWLSHSNLMKNASVTEETRNIVTCLSPRGAGDVDIRRVNPRGDNFLFNFEHYISNKMLDPNFVSAWRAYTDKETAARGEYSALNASYRAKVAEIVSYGSRAESKRAEITAQELVRASLIESGCAVPTSPGYSGYTAANFAISAAAAAMNSALQSAAAAETEANTLLDGLRAINTRLSFAKNFTDAQLALISRLTHMSEICEPAFAESDTSAPSVDDMNRAFTTLTATFANFAADTSVPNATILRGGTVSCEGLSAPLARADIYSENGRIILSAELYSGAFNNVAFSSGTLTLTGTGTLANGVLSMSDGQLTFTERLNETRKQCVAEELYEYATDLFQRLSSPVYSLAIDSVNFMACSEFAEVLKGMRLPDAVAVELPNDNYIYPALLGFEMNFSDPQDFSVVLSNRFYGDGTLCSILSEASSSSSAVTASSPDWGAYTKSGKSAVNALLTGMYDAARNAVISSENQEIRIDGSGIHARKTENGAFSRQQLAITNNMLALTDDNWDTASVGIGKFNDTQLGNIYGIAAPAIVGTLLAGESLVITNETTNGNSSVLRMDGAGVSIKNAAITMDGSGRAVYISPETGLVLGSGSIVQNGVVNPQNASFYADAFGNLTLRGTIQARRFLDSAGNDMIDSSSQKIKPQYVELKGLAVVHNGETTFSIAEDGTTSICGTVTLSNDKSLRVCDSYGTLYGWIRYNDSNPGHMYNDCMVISTNTSKKLVIHSGSNMELHSGSLNSSGVYSGNVHIYNPVFHGSMPSSTAVFA